MKTGVTLSPAATFLSLMLAFSATLPTDGAPLEATGIVFHDKNGNGVLDAGESGLPGIAVSNQREIVKTDAGGRWTLPAGDDTILFVIKPPGWKTPLDSNNLPQFYHLHKPGGSPTTFKYPGVAPTGPLPESVNFALSPSEEPTQFKAVFFGDPQPATIEQVNYIANDVIAELIGTDAKFGVTLGYIVHNDLALFEPSNANVALIGIPWYNVIGNHDLNMEALTDPDSDETYHRYFGPNYYSFDYGPVHFIVLDDVEWGHRNAKGGITYKGGLDERQLSFVKNDLNLVPEEKLVVLMMHIPLTEMENRTELYRLIEKRPHSLSMSGHTHWQAHQFIDGSDGWQCDKRLQQDLVADLPPVKEGVVRINGLAGLAEFVGKAAPELAANAMLCAVNQAAYLLRQQLRGQAREFTEKGGFTENLYTTRKQARDGAGTPACPDCGKPMRQRIAKQGKQAGAAFWGCSGYPECKGIRQV